MLYNGFPQNLETKLNKCSNLQATKLFFETSATKGGGYPLRFSVRFKILYRVIERLIQHCLLRKMVYLNIIYSNDLCVTLVLFIGTLTGCIYRLRMYILDIFLIRECSVRPFRSINN